jgi:hypothetical protein
MIRDLPIPPDLRTKVDNELAPGEHIEWIGVPRPHYFTPASTSAFLFAIPWTAFAIFWMSAASWGVSKSDGPAMTWAFPLFGLPFVLIGFGMLSTPLWTHHSARRTVYAITNRRAILVRGGRTTTFRSFLPDRLHELQRRERNDGSGDVVFVSRFWTDSEGDRRTEETGFMRIDNPKEVEDRLRHLAESNR